MLFYDSSSPGLWDPGVIHRRRYGGGDGGHADVSDDLQCLLERMVHAQHLISALGLVSRLLHEAVRVSR